MIKLTEKHHEYWRKNLIVTAILMAVWFFVTYVPSWFARGLNEITFFGWPVAFYMAAQGALIFYLAIIWYYGHYMNKLDAKYDVREAEED